MKVLATNQDGSESLVEVQVRAVRLDLDFLTDQQLDRAARETIANQIAHAFAIAFPDSKFPVHFNLLLNGGLPSEVGLAH